MASSSDDEKAEKPAARSDMTATEELRARLQFRFDIAGPEGRQDVLDAAKIWLMERKAEERAEAARRSAEEKLIAKGRAEGLRIAIVTLMSARALPSSEAARVQLDSCADVATLTRWLARAATASSEAEIFANGSGT